MSSFTILVLASLIGAASCGHGGSYVLPGNYGENNGQFISNGVGPSQSSFSSIDFSSSFTDSAFRRNQNGAYASLAAQYRASQPYYGQRAPTVVNPIASRQNFRNPAQQVVHRQPHNQFNNQRFNSAGANPYALPPGGYAAPGYGGHIDETPAQGGYVTAPDAGYEVEVEHSEQPEQPEPYGPKMPAPPQTYEEDQVESETDYAPEPTDNSPLPPPASGFPQTGYGSVGTSYNKRNVRVRSAGEPEKKKGSQTA